MKKQKIVIIDYGVGNDFSVKNAITFLGYDVVISSDDAIIRKADKIVFPGVGAFEFARHNLKERGLDAVLNELIKIKKKPILGICLGMQMFAEWSEENGLHEGLNWIPGKVKKIPSTRDHVVPHVGWNEINFEQRNPLFSRLTEKSCFYFDHSYYYHCDKKYISATCDYGMEITSVIQYENIVGVQFHPEKSQANGLKLLRNFFEIDN